jgi:hypothetical protein
MRDCETVGIEVNCQEGFDSHLLRNEVDKGGLAINLSSMLALAVLVHKLD